MAGPSLFANLARAAKVLALLLFFLPWVTVSCSPEALERIQNEAAGNQAPQLKMPRGSLGGGIPVADASGLNMALGQVTMRLPNRGPEMNPGAQAAPAGPPAVPIEIGVIAGFALIVLGLVLSFLLKGPTGAIAGIGSAVLAIGVLCYSVFISYPPAVLAALAANNPSGGAGESAPTAEQIAQILTVKVETAFYILLFALALAVLFNALAMRSPKTATATAGPPTGA